MNDYHETGDAALEEEMDCILAEYGITPELQAKALGPDALDVEESIRRGTQIFSEQITGERGYAIWQEIDKLLDGRNS
jgi:hypothetical protein